MEKHSPLVYTIQDVNKPRIFKKVSIRRLKPWNDSPIPELDINESESPAGREDNLDQEDPLVNEFEGSPTHSEIIQEELTSSQRAG